MQQKEIHKNVNVITMLETPQFKLPVAADRRKQHIHRAALRVLTRFSVETCCTTLLLKATTLRLHVALKHTQRPDGKAKRFKRIITVMYLHRSFNTFTLHQYIIMYMKSNFKYIQNTYLNLPLEL